MTVVDNKTVIFKKIPTGMPVPGEHLVVENRPFDLDAAPPAGGVIVEILSLSLDPYLRFRMREPHIESYTPAYQLNEAADNDTISRVLRADGASPYAAGDLLYAYLPFAEYAALSAEQAAKATKLDNPFGLAPEMFLGPLGMPGLTAYSSLHQIGHLKKGETIFISSAAGAVGQVAGQIAKREGLTVIGSVGSDEKLDFVINESGFDGAFNYKKERPWDALKRLAPNGLDIYFENVGGEHLEAAIENLNVHGRIIVCGFVSLFISFSSLSFLFFFFSFLKLVFIYSTLWSRANGEPSIDLELQQASGRALRRAEYSGVLRQAPLHGGVPRVRRGVRPGLDGGAPTEGAAVDR